MVEQTSRGVLNFIGFVISITAVVYLAAVYVPDLSEWAQISALTLFAIAFGLAGALAWRTELGRPFFGERLRWLHGSSMFYLCAIASAISAHILFIATDVGTPLKIGISLAIGVGLIVLGTVGAKSKHRGRVHE